MRIEKKILLAFAVLFLLFAFFKADMRIRYIAPIIPPLVILAMYGLQQISAIAVGHISGPVRRFVTVGCFAGLVIMFGINGAYVWGQFNYVDPMSYLTGKLDREAYIQKYRPEYNVIKFANRNLSNQTKILCVFLGNRRYYSDREMIFGDVFFRNTVNRAEIPENIIKKLKQQEFTHMLIRYDMFNHWTNNQLNNESKQVLGKFFESHTHRLISQGGYGLYRL